MESDLCLVLIICAALFSVDEAAGYDIVTDLSEGDAYCFNYRWVVWDNIDKHDCSQREHVPCIDPQITDEAVSNTTKLWENYSKNRMYFCAARSGNSCVRYTFLYDNAIVNTSSFCGKVIEDDSRPVLTGCYRQSVNGYVLELCVCPPRLGREPCNASPEIKYSGGLIVLTALFAYARLA